MNNFSAVIGTHHWTEGATKYVALITENIVGGKLADNPEIYREAFAFRTEAERAIRENLMFLTIANQPRSVLPTPQMVGNYWCSVEVDTSGVTYHNDLPVGIFTGPLQPGWRDNF